MSTLPDDMVDKWVAARMARQEILARTPLPLLSWVIDESALRCPIGGWDIHEEQLRHLLKIGQMRGLEIQVMPMERTHHAGMGGSFILLTPKGRSQIAFAEVQHVNRLITDPDQVRIMNARYSSIRAQALNLSESLALIEKITGER
ncbi:DUF5753 domain-containing protein [Kitasatospora purpeofusca]|uniref:DUF5753 domain-containing protein n=1 Tax=Kitasatospora purpeofusca TaxID=67352 RepID=UPI0036D3BE8A